MDNLIIIAIIVFVIGLALGYIYKFKKRGDRCIGCPYSKSCDGNCNDNKYLR